MNPQRLRHRITFQSPLITRNMDTGDAITSWVDEYTDVAAEVLTGPGRDEITSGAKYDEIAARITCWWFPGLTPKWRILWEGRIYEIISCDTDVTGRKEWRVVVRFGMGDGT